MAKLPCIPQSRIFTLKETGETMSYDQVRQYLMSNPELWLGEKEGKEVAMPKAPYVQEVIPPINEEQAAGEKEVEALKKGDKITTTNPIRLLKGIYGKRNADGSIRSAHTGVNGIFSSITEKIARRYEGEEGVVVFEIPAGVTVETVEIANTGESKGTPISTVRQMETDAINASDAQVVKLITFDSRGRENQYIIKDPALRKIGYKPSQREAEAATNTPEAIAARIRKKKTKGALSAIDFGIISVTIYNGALEFMASQVEKGTKLGNAIANTIKWIDDKMKGEKWNKGAFGKYMNDTYKVTLGDGREVEVVRDDSKETAEVINGWYQPIEQKLLDSKEESLPANKWAERLKSKEDEDFWTGVRAFLEKKGTERVSRKELLDFIKDNRVEVVTVVKGDKLKEYAAKRDAAEKKAEELEAEANRLEFIDKNYKEADALNREAAQWRTEAARMEEFLRSGDTGAKFQQYQLPGDKENYKEVLVTLPSRADVVKEYNYKLIDYNNYLKSLDRPTPEERQKADAMKSELDALKSKLPKIVSYQQGFAYLRDEFKSSHFDEPDILVHLRMNTRMGTWEVKKGDKFIDGNGNLVVATENTTQSGKVLFLEEVQSDWGQKGKKEGFDLTEKEVKDKFDQADAALKSVEKKIDTKYGKDWDSRGDIEDVLSKEDYSEYQKAASERAKWGNLLGKEYKTGTPTAPFVMDTNAWVKLGLKTALQEAVRQGADKIAWTTGEQQNDRYDLSKQVEYIDYWKNDNGTYGFSLPTEFTKPSELTASELENYLGKEVAKKIVEDTSNPTEDKPKRLQGEDLKVGGKGMKGFYGSAQEGSKGIIGGVAEKLFGQKVGEVRINKAKFGGIKQKGWVINIEGDIYEKQFDSKKEAEDFVETPKFQRDVLGYEYVIKENPNIDLSTQSSISITPELKAQVEKGLPLFGTEQQDAVVKFLRAQRANPNIIGLNAGLWNGLLMVVEKAWLASKSAAKAIQAGIKWLEDQKEDPKEWEKYLGPVRERMQKLEAELKEEKPAAVAPTTKKKEEAPEGKKPVRELPEAPEGQVVKAVLGRSYQATTSEKVAEAIKKNGLFRTPGTIEAAFANGRKFVDELGWEGAYEVFQDLSTTFNEGLVLDEDTRIGIFAALTEDLQKIIDSPQSSIEQQANASIMQAEVMAKMSVLASGGGKRLRMIQEIYKRNTVPYQYEQRIKQWKALFPDSEVTKELEEKLRAAEAKYNEIHKKFMALANKEQEQAESEAVENIKEDIQEEKKAAKKVTTSILKTLAAKVRKLGLTRPGMFSAATPASLAWDAAVEAVAVALEAGGSIEIAIKKGIQAIKNSNWYKNLSDKDKNKAESEFVNHHADLMEEGMGMAEVVKGNIVIPHSLIRYYVSEGMTDIDQIADAILEGLSEKYPDLTQREVRDAITGYGRKVKKRTKDQINEDILTLKSEGRLRSQLEDLQNGIKKEKDPKRKKELSELAKNLKKEIDKIHEDMFGHTTRQMSDDERLAAYKKRAAERIKELNRKIAEKDFAKKPKRPPVDFDQEARDLEVEQYNLDEEWADLLRQEELRNRSFKTVVGDYLLNIWGIPRSVVVGIDYGVFAIQTGLSLFNSRKQTAKAFSSALSSIKSVSNYQRVDAALKAHPQYLDAKKAGLKFYSPKDPEIMKGDMMSASSLQRAWNGIGQAFIKLARVAIGSEKEKQWYENWKKINPLSGLERSQAAFVNTLNFGLYLRGAEIARERGYTSYKANPEVFKDIADVANTLSRKAALGGLENNKKFMTAMSAAFFSAQNWASLIKVASPYMFFWLGSKRAGAMNWRQLSPAQRVYAEIMVKAVGSYLSTLLLVKFLTGWEDDDMDDEERKKKGAITVNMTDPRRSDYLKVRLPEGTIDPFAGLTQEVILSYRIAMDMLGNRGFVSSKTGIESYLGEGTTPSWLGLIGKQAEGKLSPSTRYAYRLLLSKPVKGQPSYIRKMVTTGEEVNMKEEAVDLFTNLTYETAMDQYKDYSVLPATFLSLLAGLGYGFTREERIEEKAIGKQIQETLGPEKKYLAYEKALKGYLREGDEELAKKVFTKSLQGQSEAKKSIEMFKELGADNIPQKYNLESEDFDELLSVAKTGMPVNVSYMTAKKAARMKEVNALSKEALDRIKSDYAVQYEELQSASRVLKSLNIKNQNGQPVDWDKKLNSINWVKKYKKVMGIK